MEGNTLNPLDSRQRETALHELQGREWDLLVIGGGITGAGIALDAASRGLRTALVEMDDYASGTSSRSTKLIHGGLRYLKQLEFRLVAEVGRERATLHKNAPHLVLPEKMLLPVVKGGTFGWLGVAVGLWIYDRLAGVRREERRRMLSLSATTRLEPLLKPAGLKASGLYSEYRTDDGRLTMEVIKAAVKHGAWCLNHIIVEGFAYDPGTGKMCGAKLKDQLSGIEWKVKAKHVVNATGPWVDDLGKSDGAIKGKRLHLTKGVHLVVPHERLPISQSIYFDIPDGRMMFVIPRGPWTYLGTTDTEFKGDIRNPRATQADVDYLLSATNAYFPEARLTQGDISSSWAGIRPLIHEEGKSPSQLSRKDEIFIAKSGLLTIAGGKLTGYRKMAERITDIIVDQMVDEGSLNQKVKCRTADISLGTGLPAQTATAVSFDASALSKELSSKHQVDLREMEWLVGLFGGAARDILAGIEPAPTKEALVLKALEYTVAEEGVCTLGDFLIRRTALLYFGRPWIPPILEMVQGHLEAHLPWKAGIDPGNDFARAFKDVVDFPQND